MQRKTETVRLRESSQSCSGVSQAARLLRPTEWEFWSQLKLKMVFSIVTQILSGLESATWPV
jgi:hypothetical protein